MSAADRLDVIEARANAATEGPWGVGYRHHVQASEFCECRPDYGPLVWVGETRINGGRRVPTHIHRAEASWHDSTTVYSEALPDVATVALSTDEYHEISPADAEFIAHARTDVPALVAALRGVVALHHLDTITLDDPACVDNDCEHAETGDKHTTFKVKICSYCWDVAETASDAHHEYGIDRDLRYPCPTVAAITAALAPKEGP